jgi:hypothetical protein
MKLPTTRARLALYRKRAADNKHGWNDWRRHRYASTWGTAWHALSQDGRKIYADKRGTLGDYLGDWESLLPYRACDATGYYADSYCDDVIKGGAERIRTARGTYYVPLTYCTGWEGITYHWADAEIVPRGSTQCDHDEAIRAAAKSADYYAEREADRSREEDAKQRAADDIADARINIHETNKAARALLAEIRGREFSENVCAALRHRLGEYLQERRRMFERISEREANYWSAVSC